VELEKQKAAREKYISKIDRKDVNLKIDRNCEEIFKGIFEQIDPDNMDIEVEFEGSRTTFKIAENPGAAVPLQNKERFSRKYSFLFSSIRNSATTAVEKRTKVKSKTFEDFKEIVAPFFSLSKDEFFFADEWGSVYLDNLPLRQTLLPLGSRIKSVVPFLRIVLTNHFKYEEIIQEKIKKGDRELDIARQKKLNQESKESYEHEQAKRMADDRKTKAEEYFKFQEKFQQRKGLISSILFLVVLGLWINNLFQRFDFGDIYSMRNGISAALEQTYENDIEPKDFYKNFNRDLILNTPDSSQYAFFRLNYIWSEATLVMTKYKTVPCKSSNDYINYYYTETGAKCIDPTERDKAPFEANGITYTYHSNPPDSVGLSVRRGSFDNSGYRMRVEFGNGATNITTADEIGNFSDPYAAEFYSLNFVVYNPSLMKLACVYRMTVQYNKDIKSIQNFIYIFNKEEKSGAYTVCRNIILTIAALLLIALILDLFQLVPESKEGIDIELLLLKMRIKDEKSKVLLDEDEIQVNTNFKVFRLCGFILKVYPPTLSFMLNFVTVVLLLLEASLDASLQNQVKDVKFETGKAINCSNMIQANYVDTIISAVLVLMLMMVLLRYLAQIIPFLARFLGIVNKLMKNVFILGTIIVILFLLLAVFGTYTYGPYFPLLSNFSFFYTAVVLLAMKRNIFFEDDDEGQNYRIMSSNIGTYCFNLVIIFVYIAISFLIVKVITAMVLKSIKETNKSMKNERKEIKMRYEKALNLIKEKFFEEYRESLKNKKAD